MSLSESWVGPRERAVAGGIDQMGDADLVALVLGTGCLGLPVGVLAATILEEQGGIGGLARAGIGELGQRAGMGPAKGARLAAAVEMWARPRLATLDHEELWVLALDGHHGLRAARRVASGGIHGLHVAALDPIRVALREAASAFILVHNHPSGDPAPSDEDIAFTRAVADAA